MRDHLFAELLEGGQRAWNFPTGLLAVQSSTVRKGVVAYRVRAESARVFHLISVFYAV